MHAEQSPGPIRGSERPTDRWRPTIATNRHETIRLLEAEMYVAGRPALHEGCSVFRTVNIINCTRAAPYLEL